MRLGGRTVLTDPFLTDYASPLAGVGPRRYVPPGLAIGDLPLIDLIVVSHNHYEHLDLRTIAALPERERTTVVVPLGLGRYFATRGFRDVRELGWYGATRVGPLAVKALPAIHFSKRGLFDRNRTLWASFAIEAEDGSRLYFGGDTAYGPVFAEIGEREGPFDLAMLGIGAYEPRAVMSASHATPEEAVRIARDLGARRIVGMHWGTIVLTPEPPFEAPARFRAAAEALGYAADEVWLLRIGESRSLPPPTARAANRPT
jgi:L-ascorbate metabolism protein UlaG (beta-lactamase superfamily)